MSLLVGEIAAQRDLVADDFDAVVGAGGGAFVGMFFSLPALLLGSILGAIAAEKIGAKRSDRAALRAGAGAAVGFMLAAAARLACAAAMIALFLLAVLNR